MEAFEIKGGFWYGGYYHIIRNSDNLVRFIREYVNHEAAELVEKLAEKATREAARADSDLASYERELDELHAAIRELERKPDNLIAISNKRHINVADKYELRRTAEKLRGLLDLVS